MKKIPDLGVLLVGSLIFWVIFTFIQAFLIRVNYPFDVMIFSLITVISIAYFSHKRDEYYEDILKRVQDELEFQKKTNDIDLTRIIHQAKFLKEKDNELMENAR